MPDLQGHSAWIGRLQAERVRRQLEQFPAVALLGPRQVGKTTLAWRRPPIAPGFRNRPCSWSAMPTNS